MPENNVEDALFINDFWLFYSSVFKELASYFSNRALNELKICKVSTILTRGWQKSKRHFELFRGKVAEISTNLLASVNRRALGKIYNGSCVYNFLKSLSFKTLKIT